MERERKKEQKKEDDEEQEKEVQVLSFISAHRITIRQYPPLLTGRAAGNAPINPIFVLKVLTAILEAIAWRS